MSDFKEFSKLVNKQIEVMSKADRLFYVGLQDKDIVWDFYLQSFPEGTDELYKERTYHDCNCCKNFVRNMGNVVSVNGSELITIWDTAATSAPYPYNEIAAQLRDLVASLSIENVFLKQEQFYGAEKTRQLLDGGKLIVWEHLHTVLDIKFVSREVDAEKSVFTANAGVMKRGLEEISQVSLETVDGLITDNMIYRGEEFHNLVKEFAKFKKQYSKLNSDHARNLFIWDNVGSFAAKFKNTVIGTLAMDLSSGVDFEAAVRMYESKVAPTNYKRSKSLITPGMIKQATKTIEELGLRDSLERRHSTFTDVSVNDVLFVNSDTRTKMKDNDLSVLLMSEVKEKPKKVDGATQVSVNEFINNILPNSSTVEALVSNGMQGNFMTLTSPVNADSEPLFKWNNGFAWSYNGNITDSIKDKVKRAGGNVDAVMRVSLHWFNTDDLDIHVIEPDGNRICFRNKSGKLDVDMNVTSPLVRGAVENVRWLATPRDGVYKVLIDNYRNRESVDVGYELQVESAGKVYEYSYNKSVGRNSESLDITVKGGIIVNIKPAKGIIGSAISQEVWGIKTETFVAVDTIVLSPNYWESGNQTGNKHWFFILKDCKNPDSVRGFYNEFLRSDLDKHRKVFEILADKLKCEYSEDQMSGIGFSSTKNENLTVKVDGKRLYNIQF